MRIKRNGFPQPDFQFLVKYDLSFPTMRLPCGLGRAPYIQTATGCATFNSHLVTLIF